MNVRKEIISTIELNQLEVIDDNYSYLEIGSNYNDVNQRWIIVHNKEIEYLKNRSTIKKFDTNSKKDLKPKTDAIKDVTEYTVLVNITSNLSKFYADSIFLKKPERIASLLMIMRLSLLVYSVLEYKVHKNMKKNNLTFPNQKGKPIGLF